MIVVIAVLSIAAFIAALWLFRIVPLSTEAITISQDALRILRHESYNDIQREKAVQQASISLFKIFFCIFYRSILAIAAGLLPIWIAHNFNWARSKEVTAFLSRGDVILISSIILLIAYFAGKKFWASK